MPSTESLQHGGKSNLGVSSVVSNHASLDRGIAKRMELGLAR